MSRFSKEMSIIPTPARVIAAVVFLLSAGGLFTLFYFQPEPGHAGGDQVDHADFWQLQFWRPTFC